MDKNNTTMTMMTIPTEKNPEHDQNTAKYQHHGISFMTLTGMKYSHGPINGFGYTDDEAGGSLFT
jgi:hypothetical protein